MHTCELGIKVKKYHGDYGVFKAKTYKYDLEQRHQDMSYLSVGVYSQNGVVARTGQKVDHLARIMMLYEALLWSEQINMRMQAFDLEHAVYLWNHTPYARIIWYSRDKYL